MIFIGFIVVLAALALLKKPVGPRPRKLVAVVHLVGQPPVMKCGCIVNAASMEIVQTCQAHRVLIEATK